MIEWYIFGWLFIAIVSVLLIWSFISSAPEGYEDERGFHFGKPEDDEPRT